MCNRYVSAEELDIEREWNIGARNQPKLFDKVLFPRGQEHSSAERATMPGIRASWWLASGA